MGYVRTDLRGEGGADLFDPVFTSDILLQGNRESLSSGRDSGDVRRSPVWDLYPS